MRKLLNTLFVTSEEAYLALETENVAVYIGEEKKAQYPLLVLESIISFSYKGASPALMGACARKGIQLTFLTPRGRFLARVCGREQGNVLLRKEQYRLSDNLEKSCHIARNFIFGKVYNQRWVLERTLRDHRMRVDAAKLESASQALAGLLPAIETQTDLDALRGLEGEASVRYFHVFDEMVLNQKADFLFDGRNRRPPTDNMNALLSFAYVLLSNDCASALESVGLDSYVGFMHRNRPGRTSLALDLMEELRAPMADRLCITLVNNRVLQDKHFERQESGAVFLGEDGRKLFLSAWQNKKKEEITHPYLKEKMAWGLAVAAAGPLSARRSGRLSALFVEVRRKADAGAHYLRCIHDRFGRQAPSAAGGEKVRRPRPTSPKFRLRVQSGRGSIQAASGSAPPADRPGSGQPSLLQSRKSLRNEGRACRRKGFL